MLLHTEQTDLRSYYNGIGPCSSTELALQH